MGNFRGGSWRTKNKTVYWQPRTRTPDKRWKRRTNHGKDGQTMEKTDKRWKGRTSYLIDRPFTNTSRLKFRFVSYLALKIANMSNPFPSFVRLFYRLSVFPIVCPTFPLFVRLFHRLSVFSIVCPSFPSFVRLFHRLSVFSIVCPSSPSFVRLFQRLSVFSIVCPVSGVRGFQQTYKKCSILVNRKCLFSAIPSALRHFPNDIMIARESTPVRYADNRPKM